MARQGIYRVAAIVALALVLFIAAACDETVSVFIVNTSPDPVVLQNPGGSPERVVIAPGSEKSLGTLPGRALTLRVERPGGGVIFSGSLSAEELHRRSFRIVVTADGLEGSP